MTITFLSVEGMIGGAMAIYLFLGSAGGGVCVCPVHQCLHVSHSVCERGLPPISCCLVYLCRNKAVDCLGATAGG